MRGQHIQTAVATNRTQSIHTLLSIFDLTDLFDCVIGAHDVFHPKPDPEPLLKVLSSLDAQLRIQMRAEILKLHQNAGSTFIYVTHDQTEAMTMGSRIVVLNNGRIQQADTPQRVYEYPENIFVAGFIGSPPMNLFNAEIHNNREGYFISFNGKHIRLKKEHCEAIARLRANINILTAGIRPEDVIISEQSDETLPCIVEIAEPAGHEMYLHLKSEKIAIVARIKNDYRIKPGQKIFISLNAEKLHLFNPADQRNILKHE